MVHVVASWTQVQRSVRFTRRLVRSLGGSLGLLCLLSGGLSAVKQAEFDILSGQGISREGSLIDLDVELNVAVANALTLGAPLRGY